MQLIPLTGTITKEEMVRQAMLKDAAHTPHGDDNPFAAAFFLAVHSDAAHTPHGDDNSYISIPILL